MPILRLGGTHGKMWGALKQSGKLLYQIGDPDFPSLASVERLIQLVTVAPIYAELHLNGEKMTVQEIPQIMATGRNTMIVQLYDVIPKCTTDIILQYPDYIHQHVQKMLKQLDRSSPYINYDLSFP